MKPAYPIIDMQRTSKYANSMSNKYDKKGKKPFMFFFIILTCSLQKGFLKQDL